jgi:hypothetical protein
MEHKAYIIIDDQDQVQTMEEQIDRVIRKDGYKIKHFYFNPIDRDFWDNDKQLDLDKFIKRILEETQTYGINAIGCDYEYSGITNHNGLSIIKTLREFRKFKSAPIILYSGKEQKVIKDLLTKINGGQDQITPFRDLLSCKIERYLDRATYPNFIIEILKKRYDYKEIVLKKLEEYQGLSLKFSSAYFEGKSVDDLLQEINSDTLQGNLLIGEMLELSIAHLATLNTDES